MKKIIVLLFICISNFCFSQDDYFNEDGTIKDEVKRKMLLEVFKANETNEALYEMKDKYLVIITNTDCGNKTYEPQEMQKRAMNSSFLQLLHQISALKRTGYDIFIENKLEGIIFKTNTTCMNNTRRYHFKFNFKELINFPNYMDLQELVKYVVGENSSNNIILVKNQK